MPLLVWWILGGVFGVPLLILLALVLVNRLGKGDTAKTINLLWLVLAVTLAIFLGFGIFGNAQ
ncbi:MAG TPA: hypothetical protein VNT01_14765 [Symbiobacteriaceae bacterium]|nr:hypothetical protein [Symbiobacteriaceae bacterium]